MSAKVSEAVRRYARPLLLGAVLVLSSAALYAVQVALFRDPRNTGFYLLQDLAFLPVQVLLVTLIINELLSAREKQALLNKLNMVIGAFFSEVGTELLATCAVADPDEASLRQLLVPDPHWTSDDFKRVIAQVTAGPRVVEPDAAALERLKGLLVGKREFMLRLLENPNLLEHESFTELLWAVFHLTEELAARADLGRLTDTDRAHLKGDTVRVYALLVTEWLRYMRHLSRDYPYLFSLAVRTNPFDPDARAEVS